MARSRELRVQIVGDSKDYGRAIDRADRKTADLDDSVNRFKATAGAAFKTAGIAAAGFAAAGLGASVKAAIDAEKSQKSLDAQLKAVGSRFKTNSDIVQDVIQKHSRLAAIDDEDLQGAFGNLVRATGNVDKSLKLVGLTADIARGRHMEVADAATLVGKVAGGNIGILSRYGFQMKEGATATEALGLLQKRFAGQAKAYGETTEGSYQRVRVALENVAEKLGQQLLPHLTNVADWASKFIRQMENGKGAGGDFVDTLSDIAGVLEDIWGVAKKIPPEVYALMGIAVAGVKINRAFGGLPGKAIGGLGKGIAGGIASKAAPVPVFVTNPGFGGPGGGKGVPPILPTAGKTLATRVAIGAGRAIPVIGAAGVLYYIFSKNNRDLPTGGGAPMRQSARGTPSGGRNVGDDLAPSPNATRRTEQLGGAFQRLAQRGRDLIPVVRKNADAARAFADRTDKMGSAARTSRSRLNDLKDSAKGFGGASDRAKDIAKRLRDRIESLGGSANRGETNVKKLRDEIDRLKSKTIKVNVGIDIAQAGGGFGGFGDGWGVEEAVGDHVEAGVKSGKINPFGFITGGMGGGGNLHGALPMMAPFAAAGARFGLAVSSGRDDHSKYTSSGNISNHWLGRALDISGSAQGMLAFARFLSQTFGSRLSELIHTPLGYSLKHGQRTAPIDAANHYSHVHVAMQKGGIVPGTGSGDKVTVGARVEPGEGLFVLNRNATSVLSRLNEMIPRFAKGGWSRTPINIAADAARKAGFRGRDLVNMVAIAGRESTYNPRAANYTYPDHSIGLWQINQLAHKGRYGSDSALMNPYTNAKAAYALFKGGGYGPWVGVGYGNASSYLDDARAAVLATKGGGTAAGRKGKGVGGPKKPQPRLGAVSTYETDLAQADRLLDRAGDIDPTNKRDVQAVGGKLLLLGFRKAAIRRRLKKIRRDLRKKLSPATRRRLLDEQASLVGELGGIESESRGLHESMVPEAGEESTAAEDQAAAAKELAEQIKALKESIDEQNRITSSTAAIGLREAQRALADMISGEIGGLVGQRNRSPNDGVTAARY